MMLSLADVQGKIKLVLEQHDKLKLLVALAALAWLFKRAGERIRVKSLLRGLRGPANPSWLTGNFPEIYDVLNVRWHHDAPKRFGSVFQVNGMFGDEQLYITDPAAMHHVLCKEQAIFEEPQSLLVMNRVLLGEGLLATLGPHHKMQRKVLNPVFSVKHMRNLLPIFAPISKKLCNALETKISLGQKEIDVYGWVGRTALEFIAQGGLGISLDSLADGEESTHAALVKEMVPTLSRLHVPMQLLPLVYPFFSLIPSSIRNLGLKFSPFPSVRKLHSITQRFESTSRTVLEQRREAVLSELQQEQGKAKTLPHERARDILSVLLRAQVSASKEDLMPDAEIISQITTLLFAAQDTTSSALARTLQELASHPSAQARLRREVQHAKASHLDLDNEKEGCAFGDYDALMRLPFLDAIVRETLRLHAPVSWIWRVARAQTVLPLHKPISLYEPNTGSASPTKNELVSTFPVAEGQGVILGIAASQRREDVWGADTGIWRPERWLLQKEDASVIGREDRDEWEMSVEPVLALVDSEARYPGVYSGMMAFSGGGRSCVGFKFALLALKLLLAALIDRFEFALPEEDIVWNMNHIAAPTVRGKEGKGAQMPLKLTVVA